MTTGSERVTIGAAHPDDPEFLAGGTVARLAKGPPDAGEKVVVTPQVGGGFSVAGRLSAPQ
jgi:LmbE family N-acetylglucosaminyl deacetylase